MANVLHIDGETRSTVDLKRAGAYVYFDDDNTDVWCVAYAMNNGPVGLWIPGEPVPAVIAAHIAMGGLCMAHNAAFERLMFLKILGPRYGWPVPGTRQWHCTMAMCLAMALPAGLDDACKVVKAPVRKDAAGARLMKQMAKPRRPRKDEDQNALLWWDDAGRRQRLHEYCRQDVEAERELHHRILPLSETEQRLWWLDQDINDRGVAVDVDLVDAAIELVEIAGERLDSEMRHITCGEVNGTTAINQLKAYLRDWHGIDCDDGLTKDRVEELLVREDLPAVAHRALELRAEGSKLSVTKAEALRAGLQADGRTRGLLQYHAANTGRWGGRRFQPQNLKRPAIKDIDTAIRIIKSRDLDFIRAAYDDVFGVIGDCVRGMVVAAKGHRFIVADYSNIEGRVLAWLADETWKLIAFRKYDAGDGPDLYNVTAAGILLKAVEAITDDERQAYGKVPELALGYGGGVGAFQTMAAGYGVEVAPLFGHLETTVSPDVFDRAEWGWESRGPASGLSYETFMAAEMIKLQWRSRHPHVTRFWEDLEDAAMSAIENPGQSFTVGVISFVVSGSALLMTLPSGRRLTYMFASIQRRKTQWTDENDDPVYKRTICYWAVDSETYRWCEHTTYGGKLAENASQAVARDVLAYRLFALEMMDYPIVLTVHDEAVAEVPVGFGSLSEFERLMTAPSTWMAGLPVVAKGWTGERYRKA